MKEQEHYDPPGIEFYDQVSGRVMKLVTGGHFIGWIVYKHPDGQWVSLRKATDDDRERLQKEGAEL